MNETNVRQKTRKVKYVYDFPSNREIAKDLTSDDKIQISFRTGYTIAYVRCWCQGTRRNRSIEELAVKIARLNRWRNRELGKLLTTN